jgi:hypothetical protein
MNELPAATMCAGTARWFFNEKAQEKAVMMKTYYISQGLLKPPT